MCFRPPTIEGATIACPKCGAKMPMGAPKCPSCGSANAIVDAAPPTVKAPAIPTAPLTTTAPSPAIATQAEPPRTVSDTLPACCTPLRIPQVGGRIRVPKGASPDVATSAPETPTGPGFEKAPDISNTGNYFVNSHYSNG